MQQLLSQILPPALIIGLVGLIAAALLYIASKVFYTRENPLIKEVESILPGANCGACGFPGCSGLAEAIVERKDPELICPVAPKETMTEIGKILGIEMEAGVARKAVLLCNGNRENASIRSRYQGIMECEAVHNLYTGEKTCQYSCIGLGDCIRACPFGAISLYNGIIKIDEEKCTGCGKCIKACPRKVLVLWKAGPKVLVQCSSKDKGPATKKNCSVGCIGCTRCVKACKYDAIVMDGPLARIIDEKCTRCGECIKVCPTSAIAGLFLKKEEVTDENV